MSRIALALLAFLILRPLAFAQATPAASPSPAPLFVNTAAILSLTDKLVALLPPSPPGWSADKPDTSTAQTAGFQITTVGTTYEQGDADDAPTTSITIIDSANNQQFQDSTKAMWSVTTNTPQGYDKAVTIAGLPGFEHFTNATQSGSLWVIAGGRFFVQVETKHQSPADLESWLTRIDLKKLSTMK